MAAPEDFVEAYNGRDWERMQALLSAGCVYEQMGRPKVTVEGADKIVEVFRGWAAAAPETKGEITDRVAGDGGAALGLRLQGPRDASPFGDYSSSATPPAARAALLFHLDADGRIRELHNYYDSLVLFQVLGIQD